MNLWDSTTNLPRFPQLNDDINTDVLIVGGGLSGLLCSYILKQYGVDSIVLEGDRIGSGTTGGTTAVVTPQHGLIYTDIIKKFDKSVAAKYLNANADAYERYKSLSAKYEFDFEETPSHIYSTKDNTSLKAEAKILKELGADVEFLEELEIPIQISGAVQFKHAGQMNPLKFLRSISCELNIKEKSLVKKIKDNKAFTDHGSVTAKKIIVASHFPLFKLKGLYSLKMYQMRSYVIALENASKLNGTYADINQGGIYLRSYKDTIIAGGGDVRTGTNSVGFDTIRDFAKKYYPEANEKYIWAAQDCMTLDKIPYIGKLSGSDDIFVITGFNEWGMTSAMLGAGIIKDMIIGNYNTFVDVFSPGRNIFNKQLVVNIGVSFKNIIKPSSKRCTHLGCTLMKNIEENSWDCQCHGSRFDTEGNIIDGPALKNILK